MINIEEQVINIIVPDKFMQDVRDPKERTVFEALFQDPLASLRELESIIGYSKDTINRTIIQIAKKLVDY